MTVKTVKTAKQHAVVDSPYGPLTLVAADGVLCGLYMTGQRHRPAEESFGERVAATEEPFPEVVRQLAAYFAGELTVFDLPLRLEGTDFQRSVWDQLVRIPYGETWSYGELAANLGKPNASRAVGLANGKNPVGIIVPCHRVIGASGGMTGYGGGVERKVRLLEFEAAGSAAGVAQTTISGTSSANPAPASTA
ncbi:methylated-DNA--[protein]-cysteine S-methyltransferase [Streptomyces sp. NPDC091371]|uniref:methylated-DNA--[protein]-cysteine S-methyltransferase n=1 Tax=Streptomyces sp. NPDC091371 TaxID=3155303 RepID=UPI00343D2C87